MAKKKQRGTPEELLEQALVPESEQPYEVPENWVWTKIDNIAFVTKLAGFEYTKYIVNNLVDEGIPLFKGKNIQSGELLFSFESFIPKDISDQLGRSKVYKKCLLTPYVGTIGNVALFDGSRECHLGSNVGKIEILNEQISIMMEELMLYFLRSPYGYTELTKHKKATAQESISIEAIRDVCMPLPPLAEQQRIVDRIESLFEKLDQAKGLIQDALDSFENRKAAILHKAFSGELTRNWREDNGIGMESWDETVLRKLLKPMTSTKPFGEYFRYIDIDAVDNKRQIVTSPKVIKIEDAPSRATRGISSGDVLFSMVRPYLKNIALITEDLSDCIASTGFYVCKCKESLEPKFLYHFLCSKESIDYLMQFMKGDNSPSIRKDDLEGLRINLPSLEEQQEIVSILDGMLDSEQDAKLLCDQLDTIDMMKKSILARAFRGELGTNDPTEESAVTMLKEVLSKVN